MRPRLDAIRRPAALTLLGLQLGACSTWRPVAATAPAINGHTHVRVELRDGQRYEMYHPIIRGDSLLGTTTLRGHGSFGSADPVFGVPMDQVYRVEVRRFSAGRTSLLVLGLGVTAAVVAAVATDEGTPDPPPYTGGGGGGDYVVSCPLVYSWDGVNWRLDSGTFGGAITRGLADQPSNQFGTD